MSVDFLITYDNNSKDYLFYSNNKNYKTVVIGDILRQEIIPFAPVYTSCTEDETVVEPGVTYYVYNEEEDSYQEVQNPQGSPYENGYYRLLENTINSLCNTLVITEAFELEDSAHNQVELSQAPQDIKLSVASVGEMQVGCSVSYSGKIAEITFTEQIDEPIRFQINYVVANEIEENVEYEITLIKKDESTETTTLTCVLVGDFLCLGDYETYLGIADEDTPDVPEEITVEEVSENLYSAPVLIDITYDEDEAIEYRYKVIFGTQGNTREYLCYAQYTILESQQVGYIGDLTILTNPSDIQGDFPFLIITTDEESILYTRAGGTYVLEVTPYNLIEVPSLTGGTLLSLGNREEQYVLSSDTAVVSRKTYFELINDEYVEVVNPDPNDNPSALGWYELEVIIKDNYGIGINSSDEAMGLPARAISLFETNIHPEESVKVSYTMRGILGTLPNNLEMTEKIKPNMINTQGIYTDNMYIGDSSQYLAFYTDKDTQKKQLTIQAEKIMIKGGQSTFSIGESIDMLNEVVNPLEWAASHGEYSLSTDTEVQDGKMYFNRIGPDEHYELVTNPTGNPSEHGWYELASVDEAVSNYIATHLALTNEGLYVISDVSGWKVLIDNNGAYIVNPDNEKVTKYMDSITLGKDDGTQSYLYADYHSLQMIDKEGNTYLHVSDLRNKDGVAKITETYIKTTTSTNVPTQYMAIAYSEKYPWIVLKNDIELTYLTDYTVSLYSNFAYVVLAVPPSIGDVFKITYFSPSSTLKAFTFGKRLQSKVVGPNSYALGTNIESSGLGAYAEGSTTTASNEYTHAEGAGTIASGRMAHAEGSTTTASGLISHAEGADTIASGRMAHAEGSTTTASGKYSHSQNQNTIAGFDNQTAIGKYNDNKSDNLFEVGNGTSSARSNALEVTWDGKARFPNKQSGVYLTDQSGFLYPLGYDNGTNLWIGAPQTAAQHHRGATYISSGYNGTAGNKSVKISVPNTANDNASNYDILHTGYAPTYLNTIGSIITGNSTNATIASAAITTWGKMAQLYISWTNKKDISVPASGNIGNVEVGTLKAGYRPRMASAGWSNGDNAGAAWYHMPSDGVIALAACEGTGTARTIAAGTTFTLYATYILP